MTSSAYFSKTWFNAAVPMPLSIFINSLVHHGFLIYCFVSCFKFPRHKHPSKVRFYVKSDHPSQRFIQSCSRKQTGRQRFIKSGSLAGDSTALRVRRQQRWAEWRVRQWDGQGQSLTTLLGALDLGCPPSCPELGPGAWAFTPRISGVQDREGRSWGWLSRSQQVQGEDSAEPQSWGCGSGASPQRPPTQVQTRCPAASPACVGRTRDLCLSALRWSHISVPEEGDWRGLLEDQSLEMSPGGEGKKRWPIRFVRGLMESQKIV